VGITSSNRGGYVDNDYKRGVHCLEHFTVCSIVQPLLFSTGCSAQGVSSILVPFIVMFPPLRILII